MKTVNVLGESRYLKIIKKKKKINRLTNAKHIKFGKALFLGKKTVPSFVDIVKTLVAIATLV